VLGRLRGPWRLVLAQLPVGDPVAKALTARLAGARIEPAQASPRLVFGADRRPERVLCGATRREARRGYRRLEEAGVVPEIRRIADPAEIRAILPQLIAVHRVRDHSLGRRSDLDPEPRRAFFHDIVGGLADAGTLDLWIILLDGAIGAFFIGARDGSCYRIVDGRMSGLWPTASPHLILRTEMTAGLLADPGITEIDYMRGVLAHKTQDATDIVPAETVLAESAPWVRHAVRRWSRLRGRIRERLSPAVRGWLRSIRSRLAASRADHRMQGRA
jgi:Acetyltransferase (GNAT) domain